MLEIKVIDWKMWNVLQRDAQGCLNKEDKNNRSWRNNEDDEKWRNMEN